MVRLPELVWRRVGPSEEFWRATLKGVKKIAPTCRAERYDLSLPRAVYRRDRNRLENSVDFQG
jgi:hypothetical protein